MINDIRQTIRLKALDDALDAVADRTLSYRPAFEKTVQKCRKAYGIVLQEDVALEEGRSAQIEIGLELFSIRYHPCRYPDRLQRDYLTAYVLGVWLLAGSPSSFEAFTGDETDKIWCPADEFAFHILCDDGSGHLPARMEREALGKLKSFLQMHGQSASPGWLAAQMAENYPLPDNALLRWINSRLAEAFD